MDVRQLRYFVVLAEELHFGRAAGRLHIAQPALSQQIRSLEAELGLRLLERTSRGVVLTDAGTRLLSEARGVLGRFDEAIETMRRVRDGSLGALRIGVFPGPLNELLPPALVELRRQLPDLDAETRSFATDEQIGALLDARLDIALLPALEPLQLPPQLTAEVVRRERLGIAVPAALPATRQEVLEPGDLAPLPLVFMSRSASPQVYDTVLAGLRGAGLRPRSLLESSTPESSLALVGAGLAMSVKTASEAGRAGPGVAWRPLRGFDLELSVVAAWDPSRLTAPLGLLVQLLTDKQSVSRENERVLDATDTGRSTREVNDRGGHDGA